jgi:hypothetical protein
MKQFHSPQDYEGKPMFVRSDSRNQEFVQEQDLDGIAQDFLSGNRLSGSSANAATAFLMSRARSKQVLTSCAALSDEAAAFLIRSFNRSDYGWLRDLGILCGMGEF